MTEPYVVEFNPNPVQKAFIESKARADLFSSRMGEGKTAAVAWACFLHTRENPGAQWAIIRDTWENNQATTMKEFFKWFPPGIFGTFNQSKRLFTWAEGVAKGEVTFLGMDDPADASKLMSRSLAGFAIDEPAPAITSGGVAELIFDIAMSRLRQEGIKNYAAKLAENNPDENHWTYKKFVDPGTEGFALWQPNMPENEAHLPDGYYQGLRSLWGHRKDLVRRFVDGEFGFQQVGRAVTPQWNDRLHLALGLVPVRHCRLYLLWDFGHNPTCVVSQVTPLGHWLILDAVVGDETGVEELIMDAIRPMLAAKYRGFQWAHIGDPAGREREQTSIHRSAVGLIRKQLGGRWTSGPVKPYERIDPLQAVLTRTVSGRGMVQVDREHARPVWQALRGGWHYHVSRTGVISTQPVKNMSSHPGDAAGYGAAVLFPLDKLKQPRGALLKTPKAPTGVSGGPLGFERPGLHLPAHGGRLQTGPKIGE